ncbi:MAG: geranylgeranylglyceryl/heptaprenylglyceryl phosphate synthase [Candidatus Thermoplasmatota archaeon]|jgi:phosphoglycerol geranylgeranyltransferase|nr:geranylgeranylglyceryl/heptaprenylglyceryl phosphate synthase [Candidatus Thermoplasmatota archaeon]MCL5793525.1 geranylgeranylglyceryl/heptaprenylglyceryl phosphate synthase [Candidatus Thermoplasmatota archaeon]
MTLIDPASQDPARAGEISGEAEEAGTDFIMVGGSTNIDQGMMDRTIDQIKASCSRRIIIFPGSSSMVSGKADAIYFMSLLNSRNPDFIIRQQARASRYLLGMGLETIPMGYIVVEPGMTVGRVGEADLIRSEDLKSAQDYSLAGQFFGMRLIYLEAGSGATSPVPPDMISAVKAVLKVPLIVGGGIRDPCAASRAAKAGANIIVTGTIAEKSAEVRPVLEPIIQAVRHSSRDDKI